MDSLEHADKEFGLQEFNSLRSFVKLEIIKSKSEIKSEMKEMKSEIKSEMKSEMKEMKS